MCTSFLIIRYDKMVSHMISNMCNLHHMILGGSYHMKEWVHAYSDWIEGYGMAWKDRSHNEYVWY